MTIGHQEQPSLREHVDDTRRYLSAVAEKLTAHGIKARLSSDEGIPTLLATDSRSGHAAADITMDSDAWVEAAWAPARDSDPAATARHHPCRPERHRPRRPPGRSPACDTVAVAVTVPPTGDRPFASWAHAELGPRSGQRAMSAGHSLRLAQADNGTAAGNGAPASDTGHTADAATV